jgi:hypothetical protein
MLRCFLSLLKNHSQPRALSDCDFIENTQAIGWQRVRPPLPSIATNLQRLSPPSLIGRVQRRGNDNTIWRLAHCPLLNFDHLPTRNQC